jgi:hexosaminidase
MLSALTDAVLLPRPLSLTGAAGRFPLTGAVISLERADPEMEAIGRRLQAAVRSDLNLHCPLATGAAERPGRVELELRSSGPGSCDGYELIVEPSLISLRARAPQGLFYGVMTLVQLLRQAGDHLPAGVIRDEPEFEVRGVMLDVSRNKVPTVDTLFMLIDELGEWKINHLQLYVEHTFAYRDHADVWALSSPLTSEDILALGERCRANYIDLVPNQNSFGHLHRWLERPRYRHLAECDSWVHPRGHTVPGPFSLCPTDPASLEFLDGLYAELLPNFTSRFFNVGCDETWDVGQGRSSAACERLGKGRVYLDFLLGVQRLVKEHDRTMMAWADIIIEHPELVPELPDDLILLEWGYEAEHPFERNASLIACAEKKFFVCPGTSSWNALTGRTENCLGNLRSAAAAGKRNGATGYLVTDWGDRGHWQPLALSYLGFAAGAGYAWSAGEYAREEIIPSLDLHVFHDRNQRLGAAAYELGNAYLHTEKSMPNGTALFHLLYDPLTLAVAEGERLVGPQALERTLDYLSRASELLRNSVPLREDGDTLIAEFEWARRTAAHACRRGLLSLTNSREERLQLAEDLRLLAGDFQDLWLRRNRPGGMSDSFHSLANRAVEYL